MARAIRVVVVGDPDTGKTSLISCLANGLAGFPNEVPPELDTVFIPKGLYPDTDIGPLIIIDTSSSPRPSRSGVLKRCVALAKADVVVVTYACDRLDTLNRVASFWLPHLQTLNVNVPVVIAGCKLDKIKNDFKKSFPLVHTGILCSALHRFNVTAVFSHAQKEVENPQSTLRDPETKLLRPRVLRALKRIFKLCDRDRDGFLSDLELCDAEFNCFGAQKIPYDVVAIKKAVAAKRPKGVHARGLTWDGFLCHHLSTYDKQGLGLLWTVLRKYGYNNQLRIRDNILPQVDKFPHQSVELTSKAEDFLRKKFVACDLNKDGFVTPGQLKELFSTTPENPWDEASYQDARGVIYLGRLSLDLFLSMWVLMTLLDPVRSVEALVCIGFSDDPSSAIKLSSRRRLDHNQKQAKGNVYQCLVFGPNGAGKSALLDSLIGRPFAEEYIHTTRERYAANVIEHPNFIQRVILVLREIPEDKVSAFLSKEDALATCDAALFVYDRSSAPSWEKATRMLEDVANRSKATGYEVPCVLVAAKTDLKPYLTEVQDSERVCKNMGILPHTCLSSKLKYLNFIFHNIIKVADNLLPSIPETSAEKRRKLNMKRLLVLFSVGAVAALQVFSRMLKIPRGAKLAWAQGFGDCLLPL